MHPLALVVPLLAVVVGVPFTDPVPGPAPRNQYLARAASDGHDYLALWIDQRSHPPATFATRVSSDGRVLDPTGIRIADDDMFFPTMIWSGTSYLIAWTHSEDFWLMRINRDGVVIDGPRLLMSTRDPQLRRTTARTSWSRTPSRTACTSSRAHCFSRATQRWCAT